MGKRILVQRRGRGTPTFRAHTIYRVAPVGYPSALSSIA
ncbi:MAG: 50S ribosomal protein L2, partial [Candidatus Bathyarchaeota archaeon]|nr:50S ribosomal protein L2 [Candidatus Bathyarchaeota archaeon]